MPAWRSSNITKARRRGNRPEARAPRRPDPGTPPGARAGHPALPRRPPGGAGPPPRPCGGPPPPPLFWTLDFGLWIRFARSARRPPQAQRRGETRKADRGEQAAVDEEDGDRRGVAAGVGG